MNQSIKNNITHTHRIFTGQALCCNCLHNFGSAFFFKRLYIRCLRLSLCWSGYTILFSSFLTCGGSYLKRPRRWIIPLTTNPFATVERMRAPVGSPPGPAGASSSTPLPEQLQAGWGLRIPHLIIHSVPSLGPGHTPAATGTRRVLKPSKGWRGEKLQAQMVFFYIGPSVCLSVIRQVKLLCICLNISLHLSGQRRWKYNYLLTYREGVHACHTQLC